MDKKIFLLLYNFAFKHKIIYNAVKLITKGSACFFFVIFGIETVFLAACWDERIFCFFFPVVFVICFNMFLRKVIGRKRPFIELKKESMVKHKENGSFPSNHSASAMIIAFAFFYINDKAGVIVFIMAVITGLSRVFAGLHYLSDVIAGFFIGAFFGYLFFMGV